MTQEEKQLLLIDLSARLPYGVKFQVEDSNVYTLDAANYFALQVEDIAFKPYLRPMSSMTEEEENEWRGLNVGPLFEAIGKPHTRIGDLILRAKSQYEPLDWLNAHHFDYRGLIEKGLAFEAPEGMY